MAVPWRSTGARAVGTTALSMTVASNFPAGWAEGDLLILVVETENQNAGGTPTSGSPSTGTWTQIGTSQGVGTAGTAGATGLQVYWKIAEASEGTVTVPDSGVYTMGWIMAYGPDPNTTTPVDGTPAGGTEATSDTSGSATQITTGFADETVVVVASNAVDSTTAQYSGGFTNANLTGLATRINQNSQTQNGGGCGSCDGVKAAAGATGATTWTQGSASAKCFLTFALKNPAVVVNQAAGYAEGTGEAPNATANVQNGVTETVTSADTVSVQVLYIPAGGAAATVTPGSADGAGDAQAANVTASGTSSPAQAEGTGQAQNATVTASGTTLPAQAEGTGQGLDAVVTASGKATPDAADATGAADNAIPAGPSTPVTYVNDTAGASVSSRQAAVTAATGAGNTLVVIAAMGGTGSPAVTGVADSQGNNYTQAAAYDTSAPLLYAWTATGATLPLTTADTVTVTFAGPTVSGAGIIAVACPGVAVIDVNATPASGTSTTPSIGGTPAQAGETAVAGFAWSNPGGAGSVSAPFTLAGQNHVASNIYTTAAYATSPAQGAGLTASASITSTAWRAVLLSFAPSVPVTVTPGSADGAGQAYDAAVTASGTALPDAATGTGTADNAVPVTGSVTTATAGSADGSGFAYEASAVTGSVTSVDTVSVAVIYTAPPAITPAAATGTGQAFNAQAGVLALVTPDTATGAGEVPFETGFSASMTLVADDAVLAAGEAPAATPVTGSVMSVTPGQAEGTGQAQNGTVTATGAATPAQAQATGEAAAAVVTTASTVTPAAAQATGEAPNAQPAAAGNVYAQPAEASGTGSADNAQASASVTVTPVTADGTGQGWNANPATAALAYVSPAVAEGTGQAPDPAPSGSGKTLPGAADGAGLAYDAAAITVRLVSPATADGAGQAYDPALTISCTVLPDVASGAGSAANASNGVVFGVLVDITVADGPTRLVPRVTVAAARASVTVRPSTAGPVAVAAKSSALVVRVTAAAGGRLGLAVAVSRLEPVSAAATRPSVTAGNTTAERKE